GRRPELPGRGLGGAARGPALGEIRRVVGQRGQVEQRQLQFARIQRLGAALEQQVHRRAARARPDLENFGLGQPPALAGGAQRGKQGLQPGPVGGFGGIFGNLCRADRRRQQKTNHRQAKYRNGKVVKGHAWRHVGLSTRGGRAMPALLAGETQQRNDMSEIVNAAVKALSQKIENFDAVAKFVIEGEGTIMIDQNGVRAGDEPADVTLTASRETFEGLLDGSVNPTMAYMTGKLSIDGSLPVAMQLGTVLS